MAKELTPGKELSDGRYEVVKTLSFGEEGGVYTIRERESRKVFLLKEIIPPSTMDQEQVDLRVQRLNEALLILSRFDHPHLCKIYQHFSEGRRQYVVMERIEGVTLKSLLDMSVKALPETQVLQWAIDLCDALHYMHDRPEPFIFDVLDTTHIMMTTDEKLKLINFGLDRFFLDEEPRSFTASREQLAREMHSLGDTLAFLLTRKPPGPYGLTGDEEVSEDLARILNRLLTAEVERTFESFEELNKAFDKVLHPPPEPVKVQSGPQKPWIRFFEPGRLWQNALWAFLGQPLWLLASEVLGFLVLVIVLWFVLHPPIKPREGPAAYVACGSEILAIDAQTMAPLTRIPVGQTVTSLAGTLDGEKLFAASPDFPSLFILNTRSNRILGVLPVERGPEKLVMDPDGQWLYVMHGQSGQVGFVQVSPEPLPLEAESGTFRPKDSMAGLFAAGPGVQGLVAGLVRLSGSPTPGAETPAPAPGASPTPATSRVVYCSSLLGNRITALEPSPLNVLATAEVDAPGALALTPDARTLLAVQTTTSHILTFRTRNMSEGPRIVDVGGSDIQQLLISPDGSELWTVNGSGNLSVLGVENRKLRSTVELNAKPTSARWRVVGSDVELWVAARSPNQVLVINPGARIVKKRIPVGGPPADIWMVQ